MKVPGFSPSRLASLLAPKRASRLAWLEVALFTLGGLALALVFQPSNPLLLDQPFPWLWLAPVLLALRYGTLAALAASTLLFLAWLLLDFLGRGSGAFPGQYFLGGLILTLIAGEFSDVWAGRLQRVREVNGYLAQRLESLTRRHYLLKLSHERLEQDMLVKPVTLRDTLRHLRQLTVDGGGGPLPQAHELMRILGQACQLGVASLHAEVQGRLQLTPAASLGEAEALVLDDPLVAYALARNELSHVQSADFCEADSRYLVVAPVLDASGGRLGLLAVSQIPFMALNAETLQFLSVALGYYADVIAMGPAVRELRRRYPSCPPLFAAELLRLERIRRDTGVNSALVALSFAPSLHQQGLFAEAVRLRRQLDVAWSLQGERQEVLLTLMPLYGHAAVDGYLLRLERRFHEGFGVANLEAGGVRALIKLVGDQPAAQLLEQLLEHMPLPAAMTPAPATPRSTVIKLETRR